MPYSERWVRSAPVSTSSLTASRWPSRMAKYSGGVYQYSARTSVGSRASSARSRARSPSRAALRVCQTFSPDQFPVEQKGDEWL